MSSFDQQATAKAPQRCVRPLLSIVGVLLACATPLVSATPLNESTDDWLDRLHDSLEISNSEHNFRAHLSGLFDLEFYHFQQPAPALIESNTRSLFNPRLSLFVDAQLGSEWYAFAQGRV